MQTLTDPILHDCARIIERHPDLSPQYKNRLLDGLARVDQQLNDVVTVVSAGAVDTTKLVGKGRR